LRADKLLADTASLRVLTQKVVVLALSVEFHKDVGLNESRKRGNYKNKCYFKFTVGIIVFMAVTI
jgi:hypothetical protein